MTSYVDRSLGAGEVVLCRATPHWVLYLRTAVVAVVGLGAAAVLKWPILAGFVVVLCAAWAGQVWLGIATTEIAVTNRKVMVKTGLLATSSTEQRLNRVDSVTVGQDLTGQMLGYGSVIIRGSGESLIPIHTLADPFGFKRAIDAAIEDDRRAQEPRIAPPAPIAPPPTVATPVSEPELDAKTPRPATAPRNLNAVWKNRVYRRRTP